MKAPSDSNLPNAAEADDLEDDDQDELEKLPPSWREHYFRRALALTKRLTNAGTGLLDAGPESYDPASVRAWLTNILEDKKLTATELARTAQLSPSTLTRFLNRPGKNDNLTATTIDKIIQTIEIHSMYKSSKAEIMRRQPARFGAYKRLLIDIPVCGRVEEGAFREAIEMYNENYVVRVPMGTYDLNHLLAFEVKSEEPQRMFSAGSLLIVIPIIFQSLYRDGGTAREQHPVDGSYVIVHMRKNGKFETCVREVRVDLQDDRFCWLLPLAYDQHQKAMYIHRSKPFTDEYIIGHLVLYNFSPQYISMFDDSYVTKNQKIMPL